MRVMSHGANRNIATLSRPSLPSPIGRGEARFGSKEGGQLIPPVGRNLSRSLSRSGGCLFAQILEDLDSLVVLVSHIDLILLVDVKSRGNRKGARIPSSGAHKKEDLSLLVKDLEIVKGRVRHVDMALAVGSDPLGASKIAKAIPNLTKALQILPLEVKELDSKVTCIGYV
jgi:hypothetical protein